MLSVSVMRIATSLCVRLPCRLLAPGAPESQVRARLRSAHAPATALRPWRRPRGPHRRCPPRRARARPMRPRAAASTVVATVASSRRSGGRGMPSGDASRAPRKRLREAPTRTGKPRSVMRSRPARRARSCSGCLAKPRPGSTTIRSAATPAARAASTRCAQLPPHVGDHVVVRGLGVHVAAVATAVHEHPGDAGIRDDAGHGGVGEAAADVVHHDGARRDGGRRHPRPGGVDADRDPAPGELGDHGQDPPELLLGIARGRRRVASTRHRRRRSRRRRPPCRSPCATAASMVSWRPPSEKESGVTLRIPMTTHRPGRASARAGPGHRRILCRTSASTSSARRARSSTTATAETRSARAASSSMPRQVGLHRQPGRRGGGAGGGGGRGDVADQVPVGDRQHACAPASPAPRPTRRTASGGRVASSEAVGETATPGLLLLRRCRGASSSPRRRPRTPSRRRRRPRGTRPAARPPPPRSRPRDPRAPRPW